MLRSPAIALVLLAGCQEYDVFTDTREESITEVFAVEGATTDVLFFADNSHSMQRDLIELGSSFGRFLRRLEEAGNDWQVITVTGPSGCSTAGVLTPDTPDYQDAFAAGVMTPPGEDLVDEWGLFNARQAVINAAPGLCNAGFLRPEAGLHVVFLSDEADHSPGYERGGTYWRDYLTAIQYAKGDPARVRLSAVISPPSAECAGAEVGSGYADAVQATGGEVLSICADWSDDIAILADASIVQDVFVLAHDPFVETLSVQVNDEERLDGWLYEASQQAIVFTEGVPRGRDEVIVRYRALVEFEVDPADAE